MVPTEKKMKGILYLDGSGTMIEDQKQLQYDKLTYSKFQELQREAL